jgi:iron complex outermembrane receptor protein
MNGQLEYALPGDAKLTLQGGLTDSNRYDGPVVDNVINQQKPSQRYVNAVYDRPNFFIRAYWTGTNQPATLLVNPALAPFLQLNGKNGTPDNSTEANSYNVEMQHSVNVWSTNRFTYGINYRHNAISGNFLDGYAREDRLGLYLQDEWKFADTLTAVAGVRYDLDTFINPTVSPRFSLLYNPSENHSFRAGVSVGYRPPTLFETRTITNGIASFTLPFPPITIQSANTLSGSPNLAPEQIISYDAGYQGWYWKHRLRVRTDVFFNHISDLISIATTGPNTLSFANGGTEGTAGRGGGSADIYGFEIGAEAQVTTWLTAFANYTFQEVGQTYGPTNRAARGAPKHKVNAGAHAEFETGLSADALMHYVSAATYPIDPSFVAIAGPPFNGPPAPDGRVPSYVLLNLRGAYRIWQEKKTGREAEVAVSAFNALNDRHKEHPLGETIASRVMGWVTVRY